MSIKIRLRDFIITLDDWIFAVADYTHDEGIRAVLRYLPDPRGERVRDGMRYRKLDFKDAFDFMREHRPEWVRDVHLVPFEEVREVLEPIRRIPELIEHNDKIATLVRVLQRGGVPLSSMGVTGSHLPGLAVASSDIDFIVYGAEWFRARDVIAEAKKEGGIGELSDEMWQRIYHKRIPAISFEEFLLHELRKGNRGMIGDTYFDLLYVRDWKDITPIQRGVDLERRRIEAVVTNADFAFDAPAVYQVEHEEIACVLSYTHTYAGQAFVGERIEAQGVVEQVGGVKRLVVGTSREPRDEWIRSLTLLENS